MFAFVVFLWFDLIFRHSKPKQVQFSAICELRLKYSFREEVVSCRFSPQRFTNIFLSHDSEFVSFEIERNFLFYFIFLKRNQIENLSLQTRHVYINIGKKRQNNSCLTFFFFKKIVKRTYFQIRQPKKDEKQREFTKTSHSSFFSPPAAIYLFLIHCQQPFNWI